MLKDYTTGQVVFCNLRPDYSDEKHGAIIQAGFHFAADETEGTIFEEIKEEEEGDLDAASETKMSQISTMMGGATPSTSSVQTQKPSIVVTKNFSEAENDLDDAFFQSKQPVKNGKKVRLNKAEKRTLKFMMTRHGMQPGGEQIDYEKLAASQGADMGQLKDMLAGESQGFARKEAMHKKGVKTGGNDLAKEGILTVGNSNKLI